MATAMAGGSNICHSSSDRASLENRTELVSDILSKGASQSAKPVATKPLMILFVLIENDAPTS